MLVTVDPRNDYAFKSVFGSQRHARVLRHLLNAILVPQGLRIHSVQVLNPLSEIQDLDDKKLILDVKATDESGRLTVNPDKHFMLDTPVFDDISVVYFRKVRLLEFRSENE